MMNRYQICACRECAFDHDLGECFANGWEDMTASQHGRADGHEVRDSMLAISNELREMLDRVVAMGMGKGADFLEVICDQGLAEQLARISQDGCEFSYTGFGVVELNSPRKSSLRKEAELRDDKLVELE